MKASPAPLQQSAVADDMGAAVARASTRTAPIPAATRLRHRGYWDVLAMPLKNDRGGLFLDGTVIPESLLWRGDEPYYSAAEPTQPSDRIAEEVIFAGYPIAQFGHFILEGLARLWFAARHPDLPILWLHGRPEPWQTEILSILGIRNREIVVRTATAVDRVIVPEPGARMGSYFHREHSDFLRVHPPAPMARGKRVWLSRCRLPERLGRIIGIEEVDERLEKAGWVIFHPQEHSVAEQLAMLADAERIAGVAGSAFHLPALMQGLPARMDLFLRHSFSKDFDLVFSTMKANYHCHVADAEVIEPGTYYSRSVFRWKSFDHIYRALL